MTTVIEAFVQRPRWRTSAARLVACRHPLLLTLALLSTWSVRGDIDWRLLSLGGSGLFSSSPLSVYAKTSGLQAGPPGLVVMRALNLLPGTTGLWIAHILLAILGWYMIYLVERWTVRGASWRTAPLGSGLLTLVVGMLVLVQWAWLAGETPHPEDGLAIFTFLVAARALSGRRELRAAILVGLMVAWKPWAVVGLPMLWGCSRKSKALLIAIAIPAACWLPFILGDLSTLSAVGHGFELQQNSPLRVLGLSGKTIPDWWRTVELAGALAGAALAARRDWRLAFAAGCAARLLLDPAGFSYYYAGLIMATALTERMVGARPWRTAVLLVTACYLPWVVPRSALCVFQFAGLAVVFLSWAQPWRRPAHARASTAGEPVPRELVPVQRTHPPHRQPASLPSL